MAEPLTKSDPCIRNLNDVLRQTGHGGKSVMTRSVAALPDNTREKALHAMKTYNDFSEDNDPYGEHDCALFEVNGHKFVFKIDYYDLDMQYGSPDPTDPAKTTRVITLMLSQDW